MITEQQHLEIRKTSLKPFRLSGAALPANRFVRLASSRFIELAEPSDTDVVAITSRYANDFGSQYCWLLEVDSRELFIETSEAIAYGGSIFVGDLGKGAASGFVRVGTALARSDGDGEHVQLLPGPIVPSAVNGTDVVVDSVNELNLQFGGVSALAIDDATITSNAAADSAHGLDVFVRTQDGGVSEDAGKDGGNLTVTSGAGSAAGSSEDNGGHAGNIAFVSQTGGAGENGDGGEGGCVSLVTGAGGTSGGATPGAAGVIRLISSAGSGGVIFKQAAPTAETGTSVTLAAAELFGGLVTVTQTSAVTATLETGANMDLAAHSLIGTGEAFFWSMINLGSASGAVSMNGASGHSYVGAATIPIGTSVRFQTRRTGADTWATYRIAG